MKDENGLELVDSISRQNEMVLKMLSNLTSNQIPVKFFEDFGETRNAVERLIGHQQKYELKIDKILDRIERNEKSAEQKILDGDKSIMDRVEKISERMNSIILTMFLGSFAFIGSIFLLFIKGAKND